MANSFLVRWMDWRWLRGAHCYKNDGSRELSSREHTCSSASVTSAAGRLVTLHFLFVWILLSLPFLLCCRQKMKVTETVISRTLRMKIRQMDKKLTRAAIFTRILIFFGKAKVHRLSVDSGGTWCGQPRSTMTRDAVRWETAHLKTNTSLLIVVIFNGELAFETTACCLM